MAEIAARPHLLGRRMPSRSEFFAQAAQRYLDELDAQSLTSQIDSALEALGLPDDQYEEAIAVGRGVLDAADDW